MNTTRKRNLQAKAAGGYVVLPPIGKNKIAEVYYRRAMTEEADRMLSAMFAAIQRAYTTIPMQNAPLTQSMRLTRLNGLFNVKKCRPGKGGVGTPCETFLSIIWMIWIDLFMFCAGCCIQIQLRLLIIYFACMLLLVVLARI